MLDTMAVDLEVAVMATVAVEVVVSPVETEGLILVVVEVPIILIKMEIIKLEIWEMEK